MIMFFRTVGTAIKDTLNTAAATRYRVIGYQKQTESAKETSTLRTVQVYYTSGDFPKSSGSINGPVKHNMVFGVELTVAIKAQADLAVLGDSNASPAAISAALAGVKESSELADQNMDEFVDVIWQVLMDARNQDFSPEDPTLENQISNRWIESVRKGSPEAKGSLLILTAVMNLGVSAQEQVVGEIGVPLEDIDTTIEQDGDPNLNTGITVTPP
jgi:hypothetical protein